MKKLLVTTAVVTALICMAGCGRNKLVNDKNEYHKVYVGDTPISEYEIVCDGRRTFPIARKMQDIILYTSGLELPIVSSGKDTEAPDIRIKIFENRKYEGAEYHVTDGNIEIEGNANIFVEPKMYEFVNTYLGWQNAGTENARISYTKAVIRVPQNVDEINEHESHVAKREATVVLWKPNFSRSTVYNPNTSNLTDVLSFSDDQIYEYVRMLKYCGFTGVQMTDMCSVWAGVSGYEFAHQQIRKFADAAHSLDMDFTLWVWAAEFGNFSFTDKTVVYEKGEYAHAYENPDVLATFEKYYDIYAELADCSDRVIAHFSDPGELEDSVDCAYFAGLLKEKFTAINPDIDFGVDCWNGGVLLEDLVAVLGSDFTVYENSQPSNMEEAAYLRKKVAQNCSRLATWSWGTIEMETDQLAQMDYNLEFTKNTYNTMKTLDDLIPTTYWSEMDAYHLLNVFTLYGAGHLLQDPEKDTDALTMEVATAAVGPENAEYFARVLRLIEKARNGEKEGSFEWDSDNYILKSDVYPAKEIIAECRELIPFVEELIEAGVESYSLPLPISMTDLLELILPHLRQIEQFAEFREEFDLLKSEVENDAVLTEADIEYYSDKLIKIGNPIPEYNCTIGLWGQVEDRAKRELICELCNAYGLTIPIYPEYDSLRKYRIVSAFQSAQLGKEYAVEQTSYQWGCAYRYETDRLIDELVSDGTLQRGSNGKVTLTNWQDYIYNSN